MSATCDETMSANSCDDDSSRRDSVKFFIQNSSSSSVPWRYNAGPAVLYCLEIASNLLTTEAVLRVLVLGISLQGLQNLSLGDIDRNISSVRKFLMDNLIILRLDSPVSGADRQLSHLAKTEPDRGRGPIIFLNESLIIDVEDTEDPYLCLLLIISILHEINHWLGFYLMRSTMEKSLKSLFLTPFSPWGSKVTQEVVEKSGYTFEHELLGGIAAPIFKSVRDPPSHCDIDGIALEHFSSVAAIQADFLLNRDGGTTKRRASPREVRLVGTRHDVISLLTVLHARDSFNLPLLNFEELEPIEKTAYRDDPHFRELSLAQSLTQKGATVEQRRHCYVRRTGEDSQESERSIPTTLQ